MSMERERERAGPANPRAARQRLWVYGLPIAVRLAVFAAAALVLYPLLRDLLQGEDGEAPAHSLQLFLLAVVPPSILAAAWQDWRHKRLAARASLEPALNEPAIEWLRSGNGFDRVRLEGETPRETVYLPGWRRRWLLVTNRRVLLFVAAGDERRLASEWPRRAVVFAGPADKLPRGARRPLLLRLLLRSPNLVLAFTTGTVLQLHCASTATAQRVAQLLMSSPALPDDSVAPSVFAPRSGDRAAR